jgi:hypothetical protein
MMGSGNDRHLLMRGAQAEIDRLKQGNDNKLKQEEYYQKYLVFQM